MLAGMACNPRLWLSGCSHRTFLGKRQNWPRVLALVWLTWAQSLRASTLKRLVNCWVTLTLKASWTLSRRLAKASSVRPKKVTSTLKPKGWRRLAVSRQIHPAASLRHLLPLRPSWQTLPMCSPELRFLSRQLALETCFGLFRAERLQSQSSLVQTMWKR